MSDAEQDYCAEIVELRQERDRLRLKLDIANETVTLLECQRNEARIAHAKSHEEAADWRRLYTEQVAEVRFLKLRFGFLERQWRFSLARRGELEAERDAARQSAAAWKRSARMWRRSASAQAYDSQDCIGLDMSDWSEGVNYRFVREVYGDD